MIDLIKRWPRTAWVVIGACVGAIVGLALIGNFGIASGGQGIGVAGWVFGGCLGAYIGYRLGEWRRNKIIKSSNKSA